MNIDLKPIAYSNVIPLSSEIIDFISRERYAVPSHKKIKNIRKKCSTAEQRCCGAADMTLLT
jgi:hypothetical protein